MDNKIIEIKFLTMWRKLFWMLVLFVVILFIYSERKEIAFNTNAGLHFDLTMPNEIAFLPDF